MKKYFPLFILIFLTNQLFAQSLEEKLQNALDSIYKAHPASVGLMVHVESPENQVSWSGASGLSDKKQKLEADQPALIASSIKTYVSATILRLVEEKKLSINQPIGSLLTPKTQKLFKKDGYDFNAIQIQHLLSHTSGIEDYANQDYIDFKDKNRKYRWTRDEQLALTIKVGDPLGAPGKQFSYADANYLLLTEIMEQVTGLSFYDAMSQLLRYKELGINQTWFPTLEKKPKNTKALVHQYWGEYKWDSYDMDISWDLYGGGGIACPTRDLAKFIYHYFNSDIVKDQTIQNLIFTEIKTKETEEYPYYLGLSRDHYHGIDGFGHGGFWGTVMMHFPEINTSFAVYVLERDKRILRRDILSSLTRIVLQEYQSRKQQNSSSDLEQITATLMDYIEGTANGEPHRLKRAFHPDFNLYTVTKEDSLRIRSGEAYIANIKEGQKSNRIGRIISIDYEKDAAIAKVAIEIPGWRIFTDYFLLLKYEGSWKIVHKSYTWREYPKAAKEG